MWTYFYTEQASAAVQSITAWAQRTQQCWCISSVSHSLREISADFRFCCIVGSFMLIEFALAFMHTDTLPAPKHYSNSTAALSNHRPSLTHLKLSFFWGNGQNISASNVYTANTANQPSHSSTVFYSPAPLPCWVSGDRHQAALDE